MKSYFIRLLNYDHFANTQMADLIAQTGAAGKPMGLMAHILTAQQIWLKRLKTTSAPLSHLWPNWTIEQIQEEIDSNYRDLKDFLEALPAQDYDKAIAYKNSVGDWENTISDILIHLFNHGTHHRAQIGTLLKLNGAQLPMLDYILYIRNLNTIL
ncbi:DinB family protein [Mucilaginibacter phyllosphaerae]